MEGDETEKHARHRALGALRILLIGMIGYLTGSFLPAGFVAYLVRSRLLPENTSEAQVPFDRAKMKDAIEVSWQELTNAADTNPALFKQRYHDKPVRLSGTIQYFLDGSSTSDGQTITIYTGEEYGATSVIMTFDDEKDPRFIALRKDAPVTATCMVSGSTTESVHLNHCEVSESK